MIRKKKLSKPSELLSLYGKRLTAGVENKLTTIALRVDFVYLSTKIATFSGYLLFRNGWILEFNEILKQEGSEVQRVKYRYHVMDKSKELVFRYDNVPHFPNVKTHPHHKHTKDSVIKSKAPGLLEVIDEVEGFIVKEKE